MHHVQQFVKDVYFYTKSMFSRSTLSLIFVKICVYFTVQKDHGFGSHIYRLMMYHKELAPVFVIYILYSLVFKRIFFDKMDCVSTGT